MPRMKNYTALKCPYCNNVFMISEQQLRHNTRFECPKCNRQNAGSYTGDENGVLIGVKLEDCAKDDPVER